MWLMASAQRISQTYQYLLVVYDFACSVLFGQQFVAAEGTASACIPIGFWGKKRFHGYRRLNDSMGWLATLIKL